MTDQLVIKSSDVKRYNHKRKNTKSRNIDFNLTLEEYITYNHFHDGYCDYTGVKFDHNVEQLKPTLERIDKHRGYSLDNCCLVTARANVLKDVLIDENASTRISLADLKMIEGIAEIIKDPIKITEKYKKRYEEMKMQAIIMPKQTSIKHQQGPASSATTQPTDTNTKMDLSHPDVSIAKLYTAFGADRNVSFGKFKKLLSLKRCQITRKEFSTTTQDRLIVQLDKTKPWSDANVICVHATTKAVMDLGLSSSELRKISYIMG